MIVGAGPCGLGAAWRDEEIVRQGELDSGESKPGIFFKT